MGTLHHRIDSGNFLDRYKRIRFEENHDPLANPSNPEYHIRHYLRPERGLGLELLLGKFEHLRYLVHHDPQGEYRVIRLDDLHDDNAGLPRVFDMLQAEFYPEIDHRDDLASEVNDPAHTVIRPGHPRHGHEADDLLHLRYLNAVLLHPQTIGEILPRLGVNLRRMQRGAVMIHRRDLFAVHISSRCANHKNNIAQLQGFVKRLNSRVFAPALCAKGAGAHDDLVFTAKDAYTPEMPIETALALLKQNPSVCSAHSLASREANYAPWPDEVPERLRGLLSKRGIREPYTHQAAACRHVLAGRHTVVVTPTASGKSLSYALPTLARILNDKNARALWLFPTKALAQDQTAAVNELFAELPEEERVRVFTFDGDTPSSIRSVVRTRGQIVITNPDMLHAGILPNHPKWEKIFSGLAIVVIDEMHSYRGVFGSHLANLLRRLKRIALYYNAHPVFVLSSATIANPAELAARLIGEEVTLVTENGAPQAGRDFLFWNPPLVDTAQGIRRGVVLESVRVTEILLRQDVQTIVFTRSRLHVELAASYLKKRLPLLADRIASYRGGYLPSERRRIEQELRSGKTRCVVATNALELGIDIGQLDAVVMAGYPGSVASLLQRSGRAGRRDKAALAVLIASSSPLDQYIVNNGDFVFKSQGEDAFVNPENLQIFLSHIKCAAFELNFRDGERFGGQEIEPVLAHLEEERVVQYLSPIWHWTDRNYPAEDVSLRSSSPGNIVIVNTASLDGSPGKAEIIGETDYGSAPYLLFEGAIYMHGGRHFEVERLDLDNGKAFVREVRAEYYTDAIAKTDIKILSVDEERAYPPDPPADGADAPLRVHLGDILVRTQSAKFKKIRFHTHENVGYGDIHLPEEEMHTQSCWLDMDESIFAGYSNEERSDTLIALANIVRNLAPIHILCALHDIRTSIEPKSPLTGRATLYLFDAYHGGIGLAEKTYAILPQILEDAARCLAGCPCANGCPSCVGPPSGGANPRYKKLCAETLSRIVTRTKCPSNAKGMSRNAVERPA